MNRAVQVFSDLFQRGRQLSDIEGDDLEALDVLREVLDDLVEAQRRELEKEALSSELLDELPLSDDDKQRAGTLISRAAAVGIEGAVWNAVLLMAFGMVWLVFFR